MEASKVIRLFSQRRAVLGSLPPFRRKQIVVSTRFVDLGTFRDFFVEFFAEAKTTLGAGVQGQDAHIVCIGNRPPADFRSFQELNSDRLSIVEGSLLSDSDLQKIMGHRSEGAIIVADRYSADPAAEDLSVLFQVWNWKSYTRVPVYVQTITQAGFERIEPFLQAKDRGLSLEKVRLNLLVLGALCPGSLPLLGNLVRSGTMPEDEVDPISGRVDTLGGVSWLKRYSQSAAYELYSVPFHASFYGFLFPAAAAAVFASHGAILIGIRTKAGIAINPAGAIESGARALVVAQTEEHAAAAVAAFEPPEPPPKEAEAAPGADPGPAPRARKAFVLCGNRNSFRGWIETLRRCSAEAETRVTIVHPEARAELAQEFRDLRGIEYVAGRGTDPEALAAADVATADALVYLSEKLGEAQGPNALSYSNSRQRAEVLDDSDSLLVAYRGHEVKKAAGAAGTAMHTVVELLRTNSINYLDPYLAVRGSRARFQATSDGVRLSHLARATQEEAARTTGGLAAWQCNPFFANGMVLVPALLDTIINQCFTSDVFNQFLGALLDTGGGGPRLQKVPIAPGFEGRTFESLFAHLVAQGYVALGLYQTKPPKESLSGLDRYSVCCPAPDTVLSAADQVIVLTPDAGRPG